jgi:hypothetical protein
MVNEKLKMIEKAELIENCSTSRKYISECCCKTLQKGETKHVAINIIQ